MRMTAMKRFLPLMLVAVLIAPVPASAHIDRKTDAQDSAPSILDIKSTSIEHDSEKVTWKIVTYEGWKPSEHELFVISTDGDAGELFLHARYENGKWVGTIDDMDSIKHGKVKVTKPSKTKLKIVLKRGVVEGFGKGDKISWNSSTFDTGGECGADGCHDWLPDDRSLFKHKV